MANLRVALSLCKNSMAVGHLLYPQSLHEPPLYLMAFNLSSLRLRVTWSTIHFLHRVRGFGSQGMRYIPVNIAFFYNFFIHNNIYPWKG